jgi:hypothetical protein
MYRPFGGSAFLFLILSAFVSNVSGPGRSIGKNKSTGDSGGSTAAEAKPVEAIDADARRCAVAEILRRHYGQVELNPDVPAEPDLLCQQSAFESVNFDNSPSESGMVRFLHRVLGFVASPAKHLPLRPPHSMVHPYLAPRNLRLA